jgi:hypothetical protein
MAVTRPRYRWRRGLSEVILILAVMWSVIFITMSRGRSCSFQSSGGQQLCPPDEISPDDDDFKGADALLCSSVLTAPAVKREAEEDWGR